jgi:hypothetical protein
MKIEDIKVGMKVRIREWDDMEEEFGLLGRIDTLVINVTFGFTGYMRRFCGVCVEVVGINRDIVNLDEHFGNIWGCEYAFSADMLEPVVEEFTMPPPPDLGELHGVKLPAWFWREERKDKIYALAISKSFYVVCMINGSDVGYGNNLCDLTPYTGQDKVNVAELKRLARLV